MRDKHATFKNIIKSLSDSELFELRAFAYSWAEGNKLTISAIKEELELRK